MEIFKTSVVGGGADNPGVHPTVFWGASPTEAAGHRKALTKIDVKSTTQTVNIPTAKGPLVAWLNANVKG